MSGSYALAHAQCCPGSRDVDCAHRVTVHLRIVQRRHIERREHVRGQHSAMGNEGVDGFDSDGIGAAQHARQRVFDRKHQTSPRRIEMNSAILAGAFRSSTGSAASIA